MRFHSTKGTQVRSVQCCVLFDPSDGAIRHVHRVVTIEGADETPEKGVEARTIQLAKELGLDTARLQPLHVDALSLEPGTEYRVDPAARHLVPVQRAGSGPNTPGPEAPATKRLGWIAAVVLVILAAALVLVAPSYFRVSAGLVILAALAAAHAFWTDRETA